MLVRNLVQPDYLVCLEDGAKVKVLKRYLARRYGLTPKEYRQRWGLPKDYPMVAPAYSAHRSELAKRIGLGRKLAVPAAPEPIVGKAGPRGRFGGRDRTIT